MWNHDMKNGKGSMYYHHSMSCYHGDFKKDLFHGQGQLVFNYHCHPKTTYILYNGMFHRGKKHGYGELIEFNQNNIVKITGISNLIISLLLFNNLYISNFYTLLYNYINI